MEIIDLVSSDDEESDGEEYDVEELAIPEPGDQLTVDDVLAKVTEILPDIDPAVSLLAVR
jgi:hypothetical protein